MTVPRLTTALTGPLQELESHILKSTSSIEHWLRSQWQEHAAPFYASVDLRNAGFKLAPVDTNLFPGGFNNLNPDFHTLCVQAAMSAIEKACPDARGIVLVPENHTRNQFYLQNVEKLATILRHAGVEVRVGSLLPEITTATDLELPNGATLRLEPLRRVGNRLQVGDFDPCVVLLNNDLSGGVPTILQGLEQTVLPPVHAGWATRRKSTHFAAYDDVTRDFAKLIGIDPWVINPFFEKCGKINFRERQGEECLEGYVSEILGDIRKKYAEYGITEDPFVIVKADAGTYGMGIMTVKDPSEVKGLNRKQRNKMAVVKEGLEVHDVIVQEGVYSFETVGDAVAEPVVYMIDHFVVGGFYRVHTERGKDQNLNAPGMQFAPLAFAEPCSSPNPNDPGCPPNRFYSYGVIARLALLAASLEIERTEPAAEPALLRGNMKLAFIVDPLDEFKLEKDSTYAIMREAAAQGHALYALQQDDLAWHKQSVTGNAARLHLTGETPNWYRLDSAIETPLEKFDAVLMRKDPPFDMEYVYSTYLLEMAERRGARVFNRPQAIRDYNEKMAIARFAEFTAPTLVTRRTELLHGFLHEHSDIILKPLDGMGGSSVFRVRRDDPNLNVIIETLTSDGARTIMAQRYIPEISAGDKRVLVIGGEPVPFCLARIPKAGETRGNLAAGGTGVARELTARDRLIAETLGPQLAAAGLLLVGLDVIGDYLTEVNVTSPTCFQEITQQTGFNVSAMLLNTLEKLI